MGKGSDNMVKETLKKAGKAYVEGMKTSGEDLSQMIQGNIPKKRGIVGRLKQAAAVGLTMLTLGGIGSVKNGIQQHKASSEAKANIEYMENTNGWMLSAPEHSSIWSLNENIPNLTQKQLQEYKIYLFNLSSYLKTYLSDGKSEMFDSLKQRQQVLKENIARGDKGALKNYQFSLVIEKELNRIIRQAEKENSQLGREQKIKDVLKNIMNQNTNLSIQDYMKKQGKSL